MVICVNKDVIDSMLVALSESDVLKAEEFTVAIYEVRYDEARDVLAKLRVKDYLKKKKYGCGEE